MLASAASCAIAGRAAVRTKADVQARLSRRFEREEQIIDAELLIANPKQIPVEVAVVCL
jgi:hypothetical protein